MEAVVELSQNAANGSVVNEYLSAAREAISMVQSLDLDDHAPTYDQIHEKLERALRSLDGI